jgi:hypothetical protein
MIEKDFAAPRLAERSRVMIKTMLIAAPVVAVLALLIATPGLSQTTGARPSAPLATPEKPESSVPPTATRTRSRRHVDARECLKFPTNLEIHRCALKYR